MTGTVLFVLFLVVAALVLATVVWLALRAWRLFKTANRAQAELVPLADGLSQRGMRAGERAQSISEHSMQLQESIAGLQTSIERVSILVRAFQEANERWGRLTRFVR